MRKIIGITVFLCLSYAIIAVGQDGTMLTNDFLFKNGVYLSFESFKNNEPDYGWDVLDYDAHASKEKRGIQFKYLNLINEETKEKEPIDIENIWGICSEGVPYIRINIPSRQTSEFVALRSRGRICYFTYEGYMIKKVPMTIYDPQTGRPILKREIENKELTTFQKIMDFETGKIETFDLAHFKAWISEKDEKLVTALEDFKADEATEKLYKTMLIFNDRNPIYIK